MLSALRVLAVLAQHHGCRCRPVPQALHRAAAGRMRPARRAGGRRDQRGQDHPRQRGHHALPRPRGRRGRRGHRARDLREGRRRRRPAHADAERRRSGDGHLGRAADRAQIGPGEIRQGGQAPDRRKRRAARRRAADRRRPDARRGRRLAGRRKLSAQGKKRHALVLARRGITRLDLGTLDTEAAPGLARFKLGSGAAARALGGTWLWWPPLARGARLVRSLAPNPMDSPAPR
jgi:hypothetical protein